MVSQNIEHEKKKSTLQIDKEKYGLSNFEITMFHDSINYPIQAFNSNMFLSKL